VFENNPDATKNKNKLKSKIYMKKHFLAFAMLISVAASAQSTVQIMPISATYTTTPAIQFKVSWTNQSTDNHRNKVWIFVDFQPVISPTQKEYWQPATITGIVQKTAGTISEQSNRGFFIEGTTTNFSSTVTVQLSNTGTAFNWCAYASDCPPNIGDYNNGIYTLRGTPPFTLQDASGATQTVPDKTIAQSALEITPVTMTDAIGCPGYFCKYIGRDLYIDATHKCDLRATGAKNWEAYIKDSRDNQIYHITQFSDNSWWFADDLATTDKRVIVCSGVSMYYPTNKPTCPAGWQIPTQNQIKNRWPNGEISDIYGNEFTDVAKFYQGTCNLTTSYPGHGVFLIISECNNGLQWEINNSAWFFWGEEVGYGCSGFRTARAARVRCLRQL
jgi:hypothetical protein